MAETAPGMGTVADRICLTGEEDARGKSSSLEDASTTFLRFSGRFGVSDSALTREDCDCEEARWLEFARN